MKSMSEMSTKPLRESNKPTMAKPKLNDDIVRQFSKNFRRMYQNRENFVRNSPLKTVKFNPETIETSIGGTDRQGKIKESSQDQESTIDSFRDYEYNVVDAFGSNDRERRSSETGIRQNTSALFCFEKMEVEGRCDATNGFCTPNRRHTMDQRMMQTPDCYNPVTFETPVSVGKYHRTAGSLESANSDEAGSSVTVAVRVRPFTQRELLEGEPKNVVSMVEKETVVTSDSGVSYRFTFDFSFWSCDESCSQYAGQEYIYNMLGQPLLSRAFEGYNTCLFAYGQTGSGKSYSIMGQGEEVGIIPRFSDELFMRKESNTEDNVNINVEISFFEIYNEKIHDLLGPSHKDKSGKKPNLKVREHPVLGPYVEGLSSYVVKSFEDVQGWLNLGNKQRATASTGMNDKSSRSHSVFTLVLTQTRTENLEGEEHEHSITSKINLVDLAGSERQSQAHTSGDRLREGASINKSLHTLGKVISQLSEQSTCTNKKKKFFIPYRDSVLTWLLKESLGGNSKTAMLATISPSNLHTEETLSTLRYAKQARAIVNAARVNEDPKAKLIRELRAEIEKLKGQTGMEGSNGDVLRSSLVEIASLKEKLLQKERQMQEATRSWEERLKKSEERKLEESRLLEKSGISFKIDNKLPNLVNLNEDPLLSETLLYILKEGQTKVGRMRELSTHDIQLSGALIADNHCTINNVDEIISVTPIGDAPTYVNGELITGPTVLHHGDRVILGGDHYFRFNHPIEIARGKRVSGHTGGHQPKDFEYAKQELITVQNTQLQAELEEAKRHHQVELQKELQRQRDEVEQELMEQLQKTKQEANMELSIQKHEYEDKLAELEKALNAKTQEKQESEENQRAAKDVIRKLELQKEMLEQEVLSNRKRLELEAKAAQKAVVHSRKGHSKIVEQLQKEKQKIAKEVERLEALKQKRGSTPSVTSSHNHGTKAASLKTPDSTKKDLYWVTLLLREANKISQYLRKDTVFSREDVVSEGEIQTLIKVTKSKLGISAFWSLEKFEDRLVQMRELYQADSESNTGEADEVFYDPNDAWEKDDRIVSSPGLSPRLLRGLRNEGRFADMPMRLSFDSLTEGFSPKARLHSRGTVSISSSHDGSPWRQVVDKGAPVITLCRHQVATALDRFKGLRLQESVADKILCSSEMVKQCVTAMLDAYVKTNEKSLNKDTLLDGELMRSNSLQLSSAIDQLLAFCSLWAMMYSSLGSGLVRDLGKKINNTVKKLGNQVVLFLQGCENDIDSMVKESASRILDSLLVLCKHCGELALTTETPLVSLSDTWADSLSQDTTDEGNIKLGHDIRQAFLSGSDLFVDKTLQGGLKTLEECELQVKDLSDSFEPQAEVSPLTEEMLRYIDITAASCKVLLQKCQQVQLQLDVSMKDTGTVKQENYYQRSYRRAQGLVTHVSGLTDGTTLLTQATQPLVKGHEDGSLRRLCRCAEMIQKSTAKLQACSTADPLMINGTSENSSESSEGSILSDSQIEQLDYAAQEIRLTVASLVECINRTLEMTCPNTPANRTKRMLPMYPSVKQILSSSWDSARYQNIRRQIKLVDIAEATENGDE